MTSLDFVAVTDDTTAKAWHAVDDATRPADVPADPLSEVLPRTQARPASGERTELWFGTCKGEPVACGELVFPVLDNESNVSVDVRVLPEHRRKGHGSALLAHLIERARLDGRHRLHGEIPEPIEGDASPGVAFAQHFGARPVLVEVRRKLDVHSLDDGQLQRLADEAWAHAEGYSLVQWVDRAPDDVVDDLAILKGRMSLDAPLEEMNWEAETYDANRVRALEDFVASRHRRFVATGARHEASGRLVGYTEIGVNVDVPRVAFQWDTIVVSAHRGHRLGLLMKLANLELLRRTITGVEIINTWNAAVNDHMIAVNEAMGFRPAELERAWELDV